MKISKIELINFKRFTHLVIDKIPNDAKLVLLIGSNGSGKSSVFDGFDYVSKRKSKVFLNDKSNALSYYQKEPNVSPAITILFENGNEISRTNLNPVEIDDELSQKFIGRSSNRIVPRISDTADTKLIQNDGDKPLTFIDNDERFTNDVGGYIQQINASLRQPVFENIQVDTRKIFREYIEPLNSSLHNIFGEDDKTAIRIVDLQDALYNAPPKMIFQKGNSKINYDLLSHGEKQVVTLLLNFIVRKQYYDDSIIFIDEMDCHLNTTLQERLLEEIVTKWIPDSSQLWTASHALGFIAYANKSKGATIIDFDLFDFDIKQELYPSVKENLDTFEIAVPKETLQYILKATKLVAVENKNDEYYNLALAEKGYLFLPANNNREVFLTIKSDLKILGLRDRDYLKTEEIKQLKEKFSNLKILNLYAFENYLYHPDNIQELNLVSFNKEEYIQEICSAKNTSLISIVARIAVARQHYIEFKDGIKNDEEISSITDGLQEDEFEKFYSYFDMKKYYNRSYLQKFNLQTKDLVKTVWFKSKIIEILEQ